MSYTHQSKLVILWSWYSSSSKATKFIIYRHLLSLYSNPLMLWCIMVRKQVPNSWSFKIIASWNIKIKPHKFQLHCLLDSVCWCKSYYRNKKQVHLLIITLCYRPPISAIKGLNSFLENVFKKANTENKLSWWFQSKLFRLQQKFRNLNVLQSNFCTWLHSFDNETNLSSI